MIDIDDTGNNINQIDALYADSRNYVMATNSDMKLGECDTVGTDYNIYAILLDGGTVLYNPYDWHFNKLEFSSADPDLVSVDKFGTLTAYDFDEDVTSKSTVITVTNADDNNIYFEYTVTVKKLDVIKIGFNKEDDYSFIHSDSSGIGEFNVKAGHYTIFNGEKGSYLWIFSQRMIHYVKNIEGEDGKVSELSSGFRVPMMTSPKPVDGYFCYRSTAPILTG